MVIKLLLLIASGVAHVALAQFPPASEGIKVIKSKFHDGVTISYKEVHMCSPTDSASYQVPGNLLTSPPHDSPAFARLPRASNLTLATSIYPRGILAAVMEAIRITPSTRKSMSWLFYQHGAQC